MSISSKYISTNTKNNSSLSLSLCFQICTYEVFKNRRTPFRKSFDFCRKLQRDLPNQNDSRIFIEKQHTTTTKDFSIIHANILPLLAAKYLVVARRSRATMVHIVIGARKPETWEKNSTFFLAPEPDLEKWYVP